MMNLNETDADLTMNKTRDNESVDTTEIKNLLLKPEEKVLKEFVVKWQFRPTRVDRTKTANIHLAVLKAIHDLFDGVKTIGRYKPNVRPWCYTITYYINLVSYNVVCFAILQNILREHDAARCNGL